MLNMKKLTGEKLAKLEALERDASARPWADGGKGTNAIWQEHLIQTRAAFGGDDEAPSREKLIALIHGVDPSFDEKPGSVYADLELIRELRNHAKELIALAKIGLASSA